MYHIPSIRLRLYPYVRGTTNDKSKTADKQSFLFSAYYFTHQRFDFWRAAVSVQHRAVKW